MIPAAYWLRSYQPQWFRSDLAAGVTLAAYVLPAALGDASLAGLPPQAGLYACLYGGVGFLRFFSSRHTPFRVPFANSPVTRSPLSGGCPARLEGAWRAGAASPGSAP